MATVRKLPCRVERIADHGEHVYTVDLKPDTNIPRFRPGQFLHLALDAYDPSGFWPESRVFSIASLDRGRLRISYSVRGRFTARMEQELTEGRQVWLKLPYGDFTVRGDRDTVLIAGGTGITAFAAFLTALTAEFPHQLTLLYGARNPELLLYPEVIEHCRQALPRFKVYYFAEQGAAGELIPGRLSLESVRDESAGADFYLSGPPAMIRALSEDLRGRGVAAERIKVDAWE